MKRGQLQAVIIIILIVGVVLAFLFSMRTPSSGKATQLPPVVEEHTELPVQQTVYRVEETPVPVMKTPVPTPELQVPAAPPAPKPCIARESKSTCYAARSIAQKDCPSDYICTPTAIGPSAEGCAIELTCNPPTGRGIKGQEQYPYQQPTQPQPYAAGYYRPPPSSGY